MRERESNSRADARLIMMALLLEVEPNRLSRFLDRLIAEPELTEEVMFAARCAAGLPNPVFSHLSFPKMEIGLGDKQIVARLIEGLSDL